MTINNVHDISDKLAQISQRLDKGRGPPDNPSMEARVAKLEGIAEKTGERLGSIDKDLGLIKSELSSFKAEAFRAFATKADVSDAKNSVIMWVVSAILLAQLLPAVIKGLGL